MRRLSSRILLASAFWMCALAAPGLAGLLAGESMAVAAPLGGINISAVSGSPSLSRADREIEEAAELHAKSVRLEVPWSAFEPSGAGRIEPRPLAYLDRLVSDAAADGIRVLMLADDTPCWASSAPARLAHKCVPGRTSAANAWPPAHPADYAAFVSFLAGRYALHLTAIEVWNEPDQANEEYFAGPHKPQRYAAILRAAYTAIKHASPQVPVLGGSIVGSNGLFLRALYAAGIKGYYDGLSVHFYHLTLASLRSIREVQLANGDSTPLWLAEFGWTSCWPRAKVEQEQACVTEQAQAQNLSDTFRALARTPFVGAEFVYKLRSSGREDFGALSGSGARKPAFAALAKVLSSPLGSVSPIKLSLRRQGANVLASGSGPVGDFMQLEAFQGSTLRYRALFTLDRFNRYALSLPSALGTQGLRVRVYQYWSGLGSAAQKSI